MNLSTSDAAKALDRLVSLIGVENRARARKIAPLWLKRKVSAFLSSNVEMEREVITAKTGHRFVSLQEPVFLQVRYDGIYEKELSKIILGFASDDAVVADVGANFGWHSISLAGRVGPKGKVYSFEPNREMFEALESNIKLNDYEARTVAMNVAVGESSGSGQLNTDKGQSAIGYMSMSDGPATDPDATQIVSLDDALAAHIGEVAFIKIDVEGFEPYVLKGAEKLLSSENPPVLMVEFSPEALERQPIDIDEFLDHMRSLDAEMTLPQDGQLVAVDGPPRDIVTNVFMLPNRGRFAAKRDEVNAQLRSS